VAALVDRSRRALYVYVRRQDHAVSRDEAAAASRVSRGLAAFHLDKLVDAGLLRASYEAPPGRPRGRGRAPKVYEPVRDDLAITIPERRYQLVAEILADAVATDPADAPGAAAHHARLRGQGVGARLRGEGAPADLPAVLAELGYEPYRDGAGGADRLRMRNCPFHALATRHTELICGVNHAFLSGLMEGLAARGVRAQLVPRPGDCCVELTTGR
jgi:predicted ArsR family transcriptional regulator